jgi:hypothetical protein
MRWLKRMNSIFPVILVLGFISAPLLTDAATYYVDPANGNNAHDGLTPSRAWRTARPVAPEDTVVTLEQAGHRQATREFDLFKAAKAPAQVSLDSNEVQRIVLGARPLAGWTPYSETIWKAPCPEGPVGVTSDGISLVNGCAKDFLSNDEWFWDSSTMSLYLSDPKGNPDSRGTTIMARVYDLDTYTWKDVPVTRWSPSPPTVFQAPVTYASSPIYLLLDNKLYPEDDWWWGRRSCPYGEQGEPKGLYMRHSTGNPDTLGRKTTVVPEGGGWSVTSGDFNGDGLRDVVTSNFSGQVFVHFGNASFNGIPDQKLTDPAGEGSFGFQVACAGDVDKDGFDDLLVAFGWGIDKVFLYKGSAAGFQANPDLVILPPNQLPAGYTGYGFGHSLSTHSGDVNGDGYDDVLIGVGAEKNYFCVYSGSSKGIDLNRVQIITYSDGESFVSLSHVGDLNGDGFGDIAASPSQITSVSAAAPLKFYVYAGSRSGLNPSPMRTVNLPAGLVDYPITRNLTPGSAGDLNGDGLGDLLVGNQYATGAYSNEGKAYVFLGSATTLVPPAPSMIIDNPVPEENVRFGTAVEESGDFNHDGYQDFIIGCPDSIGGGFGAVYYGLAEGFFQSPSLLLRTPHSLGWSLAHVGMMTGSNTNYVVLGETFGTSLIYGIPQASVPGAPTDVTAVAGNGQAMVSFTAPASNGSPITRYTVTSNPGGITATGTASPIIVTGLSNGTAYTFTVTATNAVGTGPASAPSNSVTHAAPVPPSAPSGLAATATSTPLAVNLSWADSSNNEDGFTIQRATNARFTAGLNSFQTGANLPVFSDSSALPLTRYYYRVQAYNGVGGTPYSNCVQVRTPALPVHVGGLSGLISDAGGSRMVDVTVTVLDGSNQAASNVKVMGKWTGGRGGARSCTTDSAGRCTLSTMAKESSGSVMFGVTRMKRKGCVYDSTSNVQTVLAVQ